MESVFETLVEDSPEEESTLTSKTNMGSVCMQVCASKQDEPHARLGRRWHCSGEEGEVLRDSLWNLSASFLLELGNTISSLFGGGTSSDAKENGTDAVQVRADFSEPQWSPFLTYVRLPCSCFIRFEPLPEPAAYSCFRLPSPCSPTRIPTARVCPQVSSA